MALLKDIIKEGAVLNIYYALTEKDLGEFKVEAIHRITIQCKSLSTGSSLFFPNPLCDKELVNFEVDLLELSRVICITECHIPIYNYFYKGTENET